MFSKREWFRSTQNGGLAIEKDEIVSTVEWTLYQGTTSTARRDRLVGP
jgi:hypothetical protein